MLQPKWVLIGKNASWHLIVKIISIQNAQIERYKIGY